MSDRLPDYISIPMWYGISAEDDVNLLLTVHRHALVDMEKVPWSTLPFIARVTNMYELPVFNPPCEGDCGFCGVMKFVKSNEHWVTWRIKMPVMRAKAGNTEDSEQYAVAVRVTLSTVLERLWLFEGDTGWNTNQLMVIDSVQMPVDKCGGGGRSSGGLQVILTPDAMKWLAKQPHETHLKPVIETMQAVDAYMWQHDFERSGLRFGALCRNPKFINFDVPGNACGLDPEDYGNESLERGYQLLPHNMDCSLQQLTIFMGLAKLHDLMMEPVVETPLE